MTLSRGKFVLAVVLQSLVLVAMIAARQYTLSTGVEVELRMEPIDPRSLFRGDYVSLSYAINRIDLDKVSGDGPVYGGTSVYVVLKKDTPYWSFVSVHPERPQVPSDHVVVKGRVGRPADNFVRYGIESYFIPEGEGRALERPEPGQEVSVLIAVDRWGNAAIKAVLVDGTPRYAETLF